MKKQKVVNKKTQAQQETFASRVQCTYMAPKIVQLMNAGHVGYFYAFDDHGNIWFATFDEVSHYDTATGHVVEPRGLKFRRLGGLP